MMNLGNASLLRQQCYIAGQWVGESTIPVLNPANNEQIAAVPRFGAAEAEKAVIAAHNAFPAWSQRTARERSLILQRWFQLIIKNRDDLALLMTLEQGKPLAEARGEIEYAASFVEFFAEEAKRVYGETIPGFRKNTRIIVTRQPAGVVAAITPWNFPAAMITRKCGPALAAGCTVVVKPATETPLTALAIAKLAEDAGVPPGVLNVITGASGPIGEVLTRHPSVRVVTFTGSTAIGKILMKQAADGVKKVGLELGGNAPFIVFEDADIEAAVEGVVQSKFRNVGQTCVCANRIYVQDSIYDRFSSLLAQAVRKFKVGCGIDDGVTHGPLINGAAVGKVEEHIADACEKGAKVIVGGIRHRLGGNFFEPTVLTGVTSEMLIAREETFGPVAPLFRFTAEDQVVRAANDTEFGLAAYFYTKDLGRAFRVSEALEYGIVGVNSGLVSSEVVPFGGFKESGLGREGSHHGIEEYLELKYSLFAGLDS
ncbi:NAD-dependent succinate-semialdehyde dehydrogenase [Paraburkholderia sp. SIMBA_030]|uniref:NAD-dependent succinate-semialdehyde dehydrogenase n=1 Tax=Paraburkholderia sp. SIMBA_030 TaxID=3085773 RepID=UPI00397E393B